MLYNEELLHESGARCDCSWTRDYKRDAWCRLSVVLLVATGCIRGEGTRAGSGVSGGVQGGCRLTVLRGARYGARCGDTGKVCDPVCVTIRGPFTTGIGGSCRVYIIRKSYTRWCT